MSNHWTEILVEMQKNTALMKKANPEILTAFQGMRTTNHTKQALDAKTRELMAVAVAVALNCKGCIASHVTHAKKLGATSEEIGAAVAVSMSISTGKAFVYGLDALSAFESA